MYTLREKLQPPIDSCWASTGHTRGTMGDHHAMQARAFATELVSCDQIDWVSITDNAGGNPQLSPMALGKPILYAGKEVMIHLSCKDFNRNGLESQGGNWPAKDSITSGAVRRLPGGRYHGRGKPVFDIDSVGLLTMLGEMNRGLARPRVRDSGRRRLFGQPTFSSARSRPTSKGTRTRSFPSFSSSARRSNAARSSSSPRSATTPQEPRDAVLPAAQNAGASR